MRPQLADLLGRARPERREPVGDRAFQWDRRNRNIALFDARRQKHATDPNPSYLRVVADCSCLVDESSKRENLGLKRLGIGID
jgi:hypothetical protein